MKEKWYEIELLRK